MKTSFPSVPVTAVALSLAAVAACGTPFTAGAPATSSVSATTSSATTGGAIASGATGAGGTTSAASSGGSEGTGTGGGGGSTTTGHACPTTGPGAISAPSAACLRLTPVETGAAASGVNARAPHYALHPTGPANGRLVLFLNGSGGHPADSIAAPDRNFYTAATSLGYAVLALSYRSETEVAVLCAGDAGLAGADDCFFPSRQTIITGVYQSGASLSLQNITLDEGVAGRAALALAWLAQYDTGYGWGTFLASSGGGNDPSAQIAWSQIVVAGHSQGGGHAAAIGKLYATSRVLQLSATCDEVKGTPATWLDGTQGGWATDPTTFYGLDVATTFTTGVPTGGDVTCPTHALSWQSLGMTAARSNDDAATCTTVALAHNASIGCPDNEDAWSAMLE